MNFEIDITDRYLKQKLAAAAGIADVFNSMRQGRGKSIFIVFTYVQRLDDVVAHGPGPDTIIMARPSYDIEIVTEGPPTTQSKTMTTNVQIAIHGQLEVFEGLEITCRRLNPISRRTPGVTAEDFYIHR